MNEATTAQTESIKNTLSIPRITKDDLKDCNFVEMTHRRRVYRKYMKDLEDVLENVKAIRGFYANNDADGEKILQEVFSDRDKEEVESDSEEQSLLDLPEIRDFAKDIELFISSYPENHEILESNIKLLSDEIESRYGDIELRTSFVSEQMIEWLDKTYNKAIYRKDENGNYTIPRDMGEITPRVKDMLNRLTIEKCAIQMRADSPFLHCRSIAPGNAHRIYLEVRKDFDKADRFIMKYLSKEFTPTQVAQIRNFAIMSSDPFCARLFLYQIAKLMRFGKRDGSDIHARLFCMNICDFSRGVYDLDTDEEFLRKTRELITRYRHTIDPATMRRFERTEACKKDTYQLANLLKIINRKTVEEKMKVENSSNESENPSA